MIKGKKKEENDKQGAEGSNDHILKRVIKLSKCFKSVLGFNPIFVWDNNKFSFKFWLN